MALLCSCSDKKPINQTDVLRQTIISTTNYNSEFNPLFSDMLDSISKYRYNGNLYIIQNEFSQGRFCIVRESDLILPALFVENGEPIIAGETALGIEVIIFLQKNSMQMINDPEFEYVFICHVKETSIRIFDGSYKPVIAFYCLEAKRYNRMNAIFK